MRGAAVAVLLLAGCSADRALLELQFHLPPRPDAREPQTCVDASACPRDVPCVDGTCTFDGDWFALIEVVDGEVDAFVSPSGARQGWQVSGLEPSVLGEERRWRCVSVASQLPTGRLRARVRYCRSIDCTLFSDNPERDSLLELDTPFHAGQRTTFRTELPEIPVCTTDADCDGGTTCTAEGRCSCASDDQCPEGRCEQDRVQGIGWCVREVDRCDIAGCVATPGNEPTAGIPGAFCDAAGMHLCEARTEEVVYNDPCLE